MSSFSGIAVFLELERIEKHEGAEYKLNVYIFYPFVIISILAIIPSIRVFSSESAFPSSQSIESQLLYQSF